MMNTPQTNYVQQKHEVENSMKMNEIQNTSEKREKKSQSNRMDPELKIFFSSLVYCGLHILRTPVISVTVFIFYARKDDALRFLESSFQRNLTFFRCFLLLLLEWCSECIVIVTSNAILWYQRFKSQNKR